MVQLEISHINNKIVTSILIKLINIKPNLVRPHTNIRPQNPNVELLLNPNFVLAYTCTET